TLKNVIDALKLPPSMPPANAKQLLRSATDVFAPRADVFPHLLAALQPRLAGTLYKALWNLPPAEGRQLEVYALRVVAQPFGHNAPPRLDRFDEQKRPLRGELHIKDPANVCAKDKKRDTHYPFVLFLDNAYQIPFPDHNDSTRSNTFVVIDSPGRRKSTDQPDSEPPREVIVVELDLK